MGSCIRISLHVRQRSLQVLVVDVDHFGNHTEDGGGGCAIGVAGDFDRVAISDLETTVAAIL